MILSYLKERSNLLLKSDLSLNLSFYITSTMTPLNTVQRFFTVFWLQKVLMAPLPAKHIWKMVILIYFECHLWLLQVWPLSPAF